MRRLIRWGALAGILYCAAVQTAQADSALEHHSSAPGHRSVDGQLGFVSFENSGARAAQPAFQRGLLLLHSFEYPAARSEFQSAGKIDPSFAMAVWGEALTYNHTLWHEQDTAAARNAMARLGSSPEERIAKGKTPREREYLASLEKLYGPGEKSQRDAQYSAALGEISRHYPNDLDARALYSLSILGLSPKRDFRTYMRAAAEGEAVYEIEKRHPGALHYLIHAYDDPVHAPLGLRAARLYARIAPGSSHAQHMTSHIFFALGLWDEAIAANEASVRVARSQGDPAYHSVLWLEYAYLQKNQRAGAESLLRGLTQDISSSPNRESRLRAAFSRATWLVETGDAAMAGADEPVDSRGIASIGYFAVHDFARGLVAAQRGDLAAARAALASLNARIDSARVLEAGENQNWFDALSENELAQARALEIALRGSVDFAAGEREKGLANVRAAIASTASMEFEYGPPWSAKPLDELLGDLLLKDNRRSEAATQYERTLATYPNRRLAVEGLASARAGQ